MPLGLLAGVDQGPFGVDGARLRPGEALGKAGLLLFRRESRRLAGRQGVAQRRRLVDLRLQRLDPGAGRRVGLAGQPLGKGCQLGLAGGGGAVDQEGAAADEVQRRVDYRLVAELGEHGEPGEQLETRRLAVGEAERDQQQQVALLGQRRCGRRGLLALGVVGAGEQDGKVMAGAGLLRLDDVGQHADAAQRLGQRIRLRPVEDDALRAEAVGERQRYRAPVTRGRARLAGARFAHARWLMPPSAAAPRRRRRCGRASWSA